MVTAQEEDGAVWEDKSGWLGPGVEAVGVGGVEKCTEGWMVQGMGGWRLTSSEGQCRTAW